MTLLINRNIQAQAMTLEEIKITGMEVLFQHLGAVGMVRFLQQYQTGWSDYTRDRVSWLDQKEDVRTLAERIISERRD